MTVGDGGMRKGQWAKGVTNYKPTKKGSNGRERVIKRPHKISFRVCIIIK